MTIKIPCSVAALLIGAGAIGATAYADDDDLKQQVRVMGRVLEEELRSDDGGIVPGVPVLGSRIDGEYIPTVGAIYFVPVSFPISGAVESVPAVEPEARDDEDLWERFSQGRSWRRGGDREPEGGEAFWRAQADRRQEFEDRLNRRMREHSTERFAFMDDSDLVRMFYGGGLSYDPERVEQFRRAVIETVGKYGHRMTALPEGERLLVVVEAPAQRSGDGDWRDQGPPRDAPDSPAFPRGPRATAAPDAPAFPRAPRADGGPRPDGPPPEWRGRAPEAVRYLRATMPEFGPKERWLFAFEKADLTGEKNFDALVGEVEEQRY